MFDICIRDARVRRCLETSTNGVCNPVEDPPTKTEEVGPEKSHSLGICGRGRFSRILQTRKPHFEPKMNCLAGLYLAGTILVAIRLASPNFRDSSTGLKDQLSGKGFNGVTGPSSDSGTLEPKTLPRVGIPDETETRTSVKHAQVPDSPKKKKSKKRAKNLSVKGTKPRRNKGRKHRSRASVRGAVVPQRDEGPKILTAGPVPRLTAGAGTLGYHGGPNGSSTEDECVECPVRHVIVAPRGMTCAPMVLPPVRTCRKKQRLPVQMSRRLRMFSEGDHKVALRLRTPGGHSRTCLFDLAVKVRRCPSAPEAPKFGDRRCDSPKATESVWGTRCSFGCQEGFARVGEAVATCEETEEGLVAWTAPSPTCAVKLPPVPKVGHCVDRTVHLKGESVFVRNPQFVTASGGPARVGCVLDGVPLKLGVHENVCEASDESLNVGATCAYRINVIGTGCSAPRRPANGRIDCGSQRQVSPVGTVCSYSCHEGYVVPKSSGEPTTTECLPSLRWSSPDPPQCHRRIPPEPSGDSCQDARYTVRDPAEFEVPVPSFVTAGGARANTSCTLQGVASYGLFTNNCTAWDAKLDSSATCVFRVTVAGVECPALRSPTNGHLRCYDLDGTYRCDLGCDEGYRLPASYKFLDVGHVMCQSDGGWDFQKGSVEATLPDCLGELPSTSLSSTLRFNTSVEDCGDVDRVAAVSRYVESSLSLKNRDTCEQVDCGNVTHDCSDSVLASTWLVMATYVPPEKDYDYAIPEAEELIEKLHMDTRSFLSDDVDFLKTLSKDYGAELVDGSLRVSHINLVCDERGYAVDPSSYRCVECPTGYYEKGHECVHCPVNKYQDRTGQTACVDCPPGTESVAGSRSGDNCNGRKI